MNPVVIPGEVAVVMGVALLGVLIWGGWMAWRLWHEMWNMWG